MLRSNYVVPQVVLFFLFAEVLKHVGRWKFLVKILYCLFGNYALCYNVYYNLSMLVRLRMRCGIEITFVLFYIIAIKLTVPSGHNRQKTKKKKRKKKAGLQSIEMHKSRPETQLQDYPLFPFFFF